MRGKGVTVRDRIRNTKIKEFETNSTLKYTGESGVYGGDT